MRNLWTSKRMLSGLKLALVPVWLFGLASLVAGADQVFAPDYPGRNSGTGLTVDVGTSQVQLGVSAYYSVFEHWPSSWQEVLDSGIYQAILPAFDGGTIDPDDPSLDFNGDLYYNMSAQNPNPVLMLRMDLRSGNRVVSNGIDTPTTYRELLTSGSQDYTSEYAPYLQDTDMLKLFGILRCIQYNVGVYRDVHGELPADWEALVSAGLSPVGATGTNPVTGQPFKGNGSAGDFYYEKLTSEAFSLHHINRDGSWPAWTMRY